MPTLQLMPSRSAHIAPDRLFTGQLFSLTYYKWTRYTWAVRLATHCKVFRASRLHSWLVLPEVAQFVRLLAALRLVAIRFRHCTVRRGPRRRWRRQPEESQWKRMRAQDRSTSLKLLWARMEGRLRIHGKEALDARWHPATDPRAQSGVCAAYQDVGHSQLSSSWQFLLSHGRHMANCLPATRRRDGSEHA